MGKAATDEDEELLEGQKVFNGPRKVKKNLLGQGGSDSDEDEDE